MKRERKHYKALYFDLCVMNLKKNFSDTSPTGAYRRIKDFLLDKGFSHEQYSGYHSSFKTTDLEIFDLIWSMRKEFPWLGQSLNHFEVTNVGANYDLMKLFTEDSLEAEKV